MSITQPSPMWEATLLTDLTIIGTTSGVSVGQSVLVTEAAIEGVYICTVAGASTSTWVPKIASGVPSSRTLTAGDNIDGGGDLTANRTFDLSTNVDVAGTLDVTGVATFDVGGSFNGDVTINGSSRTFALAGTGSNFVELNKGGGNFGTLRFLTDGDKTWDIQNDNSENFEVKRYIADIFQGDSLVISNADGRATFEAAVIAVDGAFSGVVTAGELVAPSFAGEPGGHTVGSIILDTTAGTFKGLTAGGWTVLG